MKKTLTLLASVVAIGYCCLFIYSCSKSSQVSQDGTIPSNLLNLAQDWHLKQTQSTNLLSIKKKYVLPPTWKEAKLTILKNGKTELIVPSPEFLLDKKSDRGVLRKFVFTVDNGVITGGYIIEMFGSAADMATNKGNLFERFRDGDLGSFTGSVITYDVNYRYISGYNYKNGIKVEGRAAIARDHGEHRTPKSNLGNPITTLDDCYNYWYVIYANGLEYWYYLYTLCNGGNNEYGGGGQTTNNDGDRKGDVHVSNTTTKQLPPDSTNALQVENLCVFTTINWITNWYGNPINEGTQMTTFLNSSPKPTWIDNSKNPPETNNIDLFFLLQQGVPGQYIHDIIGTYFYYSTTVPNNLSLQFAIDANHIVMAALFSGSHQVMITGYNNDGTFAYFDPATGRYASRPISEFSDLVEITGMK